LTSKINEWIREPVVYDELAECVSLVKIVAQNNKTLINAVDNVKRFILKVKPKKPQVLAPEKSKRSMAVKPKQVVKTVDICVVCSKPATSRCSRCKAVSYCSKQCQVENWKQHKDLCK
jgi:hypothetical protein